MDELLKTLLAAFGGVSVAAVGWIARSWIDHSIKKSLETHKLELKAALDTTSRSTIAEVEALFRIKEARLSKLQERRGEILEDLYKKMVLVYQDAGTFLSLAEFQSSPTKDELREKLGESLGEFLQFYGQHKIFFSREIVAKIDALTNSIRKPSISFSVYLTASGDSDLDKGEMTDAWIKAFDDFNELARPALEAVEDEFRSLLGVSDPLIPELLAPNTTRKPA